jgi:chemotaxis protein CheZ
MEDEILSRLADKLNEQINKTVRDALESSVEKEVQKALGKALTDGEFYQTMTTEVKSGLNQLMSEIQNLKSGMDISTVNSQDNAPGDIFHHAADKLSDIYSKTEEATFTVMDIVENQIESIADLKELNPDKSDEKTTEILDSMNDKMFEILTALSFQDIIGQQIKKVIDFIKNIEEIINRLYVSHSMMMKSKEENPELGCDEIKKGVQEKISQDNIDKLLSEYGIS